MHCYIVQIAIGVTVLEFETQEIWNISIVCSRIMAQICAQPHMSNFI